MTDGTLRAALFDLDGTLVDSLPTVAAAMSAALADFGYKVAPDTIVPLIGAPMPVLAAQLTGADAAAAARINERFLELYYDRFMPGTRPLPGAAALLDRLAARGVRLAVVTNKNEQGGHAMVDLQGWSGRFELIVGRETAPRPKPDPAGALHALSHLGATPAQAAFVGDTEFDMHAARDAAMRYRIGLVASRSERQLREAGATHAVHDLDAVGTILLGAVDVAAG